MIEVMDRVKEIQKEAKEIINKASTEAEKIKESFVQKIANANEDAFIAQIAQAEKKAEKLKDNINLTIEKELTKIMTTAEQQAKEFESNAKINYEKAINYVIDVLINKEGKK